jgi:parallel beta-helix repeat protein
MTAACFLIVLNIENVKGANDPDQPLDGGVVEVNGDWFVEDAREYHNCTIVMNGNLIINNTGNLTLHNVTLKMNCTANGTYHIDVHGELYIYDNDNNKETKDDRSNITSSTPDGEHRFLFWVSDGSKFEMKNSALHECGYNINPFDEAGLWVNTNNVTIENNSITNNYCGLLLYGAHNSTVLYNNIEDNERRGIYLYSSTNNTIANNEVLNNGEAGVFLASESNYNRIADNNVNLHHSWGGTGKGICLHSSSHNEVMSNVVNSNYFGIRVESSSSFNILSDNTMNLNTRGVFLYNGRDNLILDSTITESKEYGIYLFSSDDIIISNSTIDASAESDIWLDAWKETSTSTVTTINTTFDTVEITQIWGNVLTVKNYLHVRVEDENDVGIEAAEVVIIDDSIEIFNDTTDIEGEVKCVLITDRVYESSNTPSEHVTTITVKKTGYVFDDPARSVDMNTSHTELFRVWDITPNSTALPLDQYHTQPFNVSFTANDGSGLTSVSLYYRYENDTWTHFATRSISGLSADGSFLFTAPKGDGSYEFFTIANDTKPQSEVMKSTAEASTIYDSTAPLVISTTPMNNAVEVSVGTPIVIVFDEAMNKTSVNESFSLVTSGIDIDGSITWDVQNRILTFIPIALSYNTTYWVNISTDAEDLAGNNLSMVCSITFTTEYSGTVFGVVKDASGDPIENAIITAYTVNTTDVVNTTTTDGNGNYSIDLPAGRYDIKIEKEGYDVEWQKGIEVTAGEVSQTNVKLTPETDLLSGYWWMLVFIIAIFVISVILLATLPKKIKKQ